MEFEAKFDDQISAPAENAAGSLEKTSTASKALDAQLRKLDVAQQRTARSKEAAVKAFNPEAYKRQLLAEQAITDAKKKARQELGLEPEEKDDKGAKKKEEAAERSRKKTEQQKAAVGGLGVAAKAAALGLLAAAGAGGAMNLAQIAIGYRGMAQLQMIAFKAQMNLRGLFKGVDSRTLERSMSRLTDLLNASTPAGRAVQDILTRGFNGLFSLVEKGTPYIEAFFQGAAIGAYKLESGYLRLRIAAVPLTSQLGDLVSKGAAMKAVAYGAALTVGLLAAKAAVAAAPFLALAAAIAAVVAAAEQFSKLQKEWDGDLILRSLGLKGDQVGDLNAKFDQEISQARAKRAAAGQAPASKDVAQLPTAAPPPGVMAAKGEQTGAALGDGIVVGMKSKEAAVAAAGAALAAAADQGVRAKAEIHSPSKLMKREALYMGEGAEQGLEESAPRVQDAASRSLVPQVGGGSGARAEGRAAAQQAPVAGSSGLQMVNHFDFSGASFGGGASSGSIEAAVERAVAQVAQALMVRLGVA